jgi:DNA invertase Pin-like site-specific DNA recombinase
MITEEYKVGIYLRLSREDERLGESGSISTQRDLLLNYIKDNNLIFVSEYVDDGVSGTTFDRAGFNRMIKDCETKKINMIITKDTSRLGRDHIEFGFYVERYFPEHGIRYVAVNDGIDTANNSSANDMLVFKSAFNDMYVKDISNKLRSSLYVKKKNGQFVGAYAPYGYNKSIDDKHKLVINEEEANVIRRIFHLFASGLSVSKICDILTNEKVPTPSMSKNMNIGQNNLHYGIWSTRTINDILKNSNYIGNLAQCKQKKINYKSKKRVRNRQDNWIIVENAIPKIIDDDLFNLVGNMFKSNKNRIKGKGITDNLLLRGLIYCKECGHTFGFRAQYQNTQKYGKVCRIYGNCNYWAKRKNQGVCTPHNVKYNEIEEVVVSELKNMCNKYIDLKKLEDNLKNSNKLQVNIDKCNAQILKLENSNKILNKKIDACYNDKLDGNITLDMYKRAYNNFINEIKANENKIAEYKKEIYNIENNKTQDDKSLMNTIEKFLSMENPPRSLVASLIDRIEITEDKTVDIYYKFKLV